MRFSKEKKALVSAVPGVGSPFKATVVTSASGANILKSLESFANELIHSKNRHGINGSANTENSIPLRDEDFALLPYIMAAPSNVRKGSMAINGTESVRYYKNHSNGVVVVVEREGFFDVEDMENITMWAGK